MAKVIVRVEVEDVEQWKRGFVTTDIDAFMEVMVSPDTAEAMANDGIIQESVEVYVADTIFDPNS